MTYSSRLSLASEQLQFLTVTEFDENIDGPFLIVLMFTDANLARASNP
jgi:hypothetical protein